jgi:hypothetical protein
MTASSMRSCRRVERLRAWLCALVALVPLVLFAGFPTASCAQGIDVKRPTLTIEQDHLLLDAQFDIVLTGTLEEVLNKGVPLHFVLEFDLTRPRWYWLNERVLHFQQEYRLSYNALTRQYRLAVGNVHQNHSTLAEALEVMSRVRRRFDVDPGSVRRDTYLAALRFRLDTSQLPKPFQLSALIGREWNVGSEWYRWQVAP